MSFMLEKVEVKSVFRQYWDMRKWHLTNTRELVPPLAPEHIWLTDNPQRIKIRKRTTVKMSAQGFFGTFITVKNLHKIQENIRGSLIEKDMSAAQIWDCLLSVDSRNPLLVTVLNCLEQWWILVNTASQ